jgi:hypothetical protein
MDEAKRGRWQFSARSLLLVTAAVALLLAPVAWVARERQQMTRARQEILLCDQVLSPGGCTMLESGAPCGCGIL